MQLLLSLLGLWWQQKAWAQQPSQHHVRLAIELSAEPYFVCAKDCREEQVHEQQEDVLRALENLYSNSIQVVERSSKLVNALFVEVDASQYNDEEDTSKAMHSSQNDAILQIPGVVGVYPSDNWQMASTTSNTPPAAHQRGHSTKATASPLHQIGLGDDHGTFRRFCATGGGVTVAILDSGIDYTHVTMGGSGTTAAYHQAYGTAYFDRKNREREGLFPTTRVIAGYDFVGDRLRDGDAESMATPDDDPIDASGHGTAVAHAVRAVAPAAELVAVKICTTTGNACPDFAFVKGLEYVLDPNGDGDTEDKVDIVNVSLGRPFASSYYSIIGKAVERLFALGVLPLLAAGNSGNIPFILGGAPGTPNALTVGSSSVSYGEDSDGPLSQPRPPFVASYSSRGPVESGGVKPDVIAPGGPFALASAGTGEDVRAFVGTSFSAPLVAGAAALVKQKCPTCSPLAIKALLMNYANHQIRYHDGQTQRAPVSLQGSGEIQLQRTLGAEVWVYSEQDMNPSIGLGILNVAADMKFERRLRIMKMKDANTNYTLRTSYTFAANLHAAVSISSSATDVDISVDDDDFYVDIVFAINASQSPQNRMYSGGSLGAQPSTLDWNEIGGWIEFSKETGEETTEQLLAIPFHMILRRASNATLDHSTFTRASLGRSMLPTNLTVGLQNHGSAAAQVDGYQLIYVSGDEPESWYGTGNPPADIRYVGYRTAEVSNKTTENKPCSFLVEFAIQTWEQQLSLSHTHFNLWFDVNLDNLPDYSIYNSAYRLGSGHSEIKRKNFFDGTEDCIGYSPDHTTSSTVSILRFCMSDIGVPDSGGFVNVALVAYSFPQDSFSDEMTMRRISLPEAGFATPSYNVQPGAVLQNISVSGTGLTPEGLSPMGLLLVHNAYRNEASTGAAVEQSETSTIVDEILLLPKETTPDKMDFPVAAKPLYPGEMVDLACPTERMLQEFAELGDFKLENIQNGSGPRVHSQMSTRLLLSNKCPEVPVPREEFILVRSNSNNGNEIENQSGRNDTELSYGKESSWIRQFTNVSEIPTLPVMEWHASRSFGVYYASSFPKLLAFLALLFPL